MEFMGFRFVLTHSAQNDKVTCKIPCHTEALAEVSIKSKRILNSLDFLLCGEVLKRNLVWVFVL